LFFLKSEYIQNSTVKLKRMVRYILWVYRNKR
jgi:hypothetical protein